MFYGLDEFYNYMDPGSDSALSAAIAGAYEKGEPIVAYYWEPTWLASKYDLVLLEDAPYAENLYLSGSFPASLRQFSLECTKHSHVKLSRGAKKTPRSATIPIYENSFSIYDCELGAVF